MKVIEIEAPNDYKTHIKSLKGTYEKIISVFLAGAIDMGEAEDWQTKTKQYLESYEGDDDIAVILLNPRRKDWDSSWKQVKSNKEFSEQVNWELDSLEFVDEILVVFTEESKAPITFLELGIHINDNPLVVCPMKFYRSGNIDIVTDRKKIEMFETLEEGLDKLIERIKNY